MEKNELLFATSKIIAISPSDQSSEVEETPPQQFYLEVMNENVKALLDQFGSNIDYLLNGYNGITSSQSSFIYEYDQLLYRANVSVEPTCYKGHNFRFCSDKFLSSPNGSSPTRSAGILRFCGNNWSEFHSSALNSLPAITSYANKLLGDKLGVKFCYSSDLRRFELRFLSKERDRCLTFSFEPGYPEDSFEDFWFEDS